MLYNFYFFSFLFDLSNHCVCVWYEMTLVKWLAREKMFFMSNLQSRKSLFYNCTWPMLLPWYTYVCVLVWRRRHRRRCGCNCMCECSDLFFALLQFHVSWLRDKDAFSRFQFVVWQSSITVRCFAEGIHFPDYAVCLRHWFCFQQSNCALRCATTAHFWADICSHRVCLASIASFPFSCVSLSHSFSLCFLSSARFCIQQTLHQKRYITARRWCDRDFIIVSLFFLYFNSFNVELNSYHKTNDELKPYP